MEFDHKTDNVYIKCFSLSLLNVATLLPLLVFMNSVYLVYFMIDSDSADDDK